jgi:soluble lytic murein transglycosylase-like protein
MIAVKHRLLSLFLLLIIVLFPARPLLAQDYCFEDAGRMYGISPDLLWAISRAESGHQPFVVNFNKNGTYDYGHMQVNSSWYPVLGEGLWMSLGDPCQSTKVGAWILEQCIRRHGYTWRAVGCYNATSEPRKVRYAWKIYRTISKERAKHEKKL